MKEQELIGKTILINPNKKLGWGWQSLVANQLWTVESIIENYLNCNESAYVLKRSSEKKILFCNSVHEMLKNKKTGTRVLV